MPNFLVENNFYQGTSEACITDLNPPVFAGISGLDVESRGQIRASWSAATDPTPPIRYEIYIQASTAVGLFSTTNIVAITPNLQYDIFTMPDGSFLQNGTTYHVGVRAIDGVNNRDNNTVSQSVISTGVLTAIDVYETFASWSVDDSNQFRVTIWANKNDSLAIAPTAVLGTASYQVFNKLGNAIVGMSATGLTANASGLYVAPAVNNLLDENGEHYEIRVTVSVDGENRTNFIRIEEGAGNYNIDGVASLTSANELIGSFWVQENEVVRTTNLGTGSYQAYDSEGNVILGLSETGIVADSNGFFTITPVALPPSIDLTQSYIVRTSVTVNGVTKTKNIVLLSDPAVYSCKATFSINASNQLQATLWATLNEELVDPATLGTGAYQIFDRLGNPVSGLSQTGIVADSNGYFNITPVSAALLSDLTHYVAKITLNVAGKDRVAVKGFTLLGT